MEVLFIGI